MEDLCLDLFRSCNVQILPVSILVFLQLRFAGDLLMELGAAVELATMAFPGLVLPLACAANVAKVTFLS